MAIDEIHKNDIGTLFKLTIKDQDAVIVDLSSATTREILLRGPNNSTLTKTGELFTDGTDGIITYTTVANDLKLVGEWSIQARAVFSNGDWKSDIDEFTVHDNL